MQKTVPKNLDSPGSGGAHNPVGDQESTTDDRRSARNSWIGTLVMVALIIAVLLFIFVPQLRAIWVPAANQILWVDVLAAIGLTGIYPLSYLAYLGFGAEAQRRRLRDDFQLFGLVSEEKLDETIDKLYQNVYSWPQFIIYVVLILSISLLIVLGYFERTRLGIVSPGVMEVIFFGYLGTYVFSVQELVRRYNTFDLQPQVYSSILVRILITLALTFVIGALGIDRGESLFTAQNSEELPQFGAATWILLVAFAVGIFPNSGLRWLTTQANRVINQTRERDNELAVRQLIGVSPWHEARLSMMGIDDAQNLATADLPRMLLTTQFDTQQIVNWIDQAILYVKVSDKIERFREAKIATFSELLQTLGEDELNAALELNESEGNKSPVMRSSLATVLGLTDPDELRRLSNYANYPNFNHIIQYYKGMQRVGSQRAEESVQKLTGAASIDRAWLRPLTEQTQDKDLRQDLLELIRQTHGSFITTENYTRRGVIYYQLNNLERARQSFTCAIEMDRSYAEAYYGRSFIHLDEQNYAEAIWDVTKAIDLNPAYAEAYNHRGLIYLKMKYSDRALSDFERALELNYRLAVAHYNLGVTFNSLGRFDEALNEFDRAFLLGYEQAGLWAIWGATLVSVNRFEQAINKLSEAIIRDPKIAKVYTYRANAYMQLGAAYYDQAHVDLETALRRNPDLVDAHNQLGNLAFRQENYRAAVKHYQRALDLQPSLFSARYSLVLIAYNQRELDQAIEQFRILNYFAQQQDLSEAQRAQLGQLATLLNLDDANRQELEETLKINRSLGNASGEALILRQLGTIHYQRGEFAQAQSYWQSALTAYKKLAQDEEYAAVEANLAKLAARLEQIKALETKEETSEAPTKMG